MHRQGVESEGTLRHRHGMVGGVGLVLATAKNKGPDDPGKNPVKGRSGELANCGGSPNFLVEYLVEYIDKQLNLCHNTTMKNIIVKEELRLKAIEALNFLRSHLALAEGFDYRCLCWSMQKVCKRGFVEGPGITIFWGEPDAEKFKAKFLKHYSKKELADEHTFATISISYEERFGEPWIYDHIEFWWELSFVVFQGNLNRESFDYANPKKWDSYGFESGGDVSWEQCIVDMADKVREHLGNFSDYKDFINEFEKKNHKENPLIFRPKKIARGKKSNKKYATVGFNDKNWRVHSGITNRRWLQWFVTTDYCKKRWEGMFDAMAKHPIPVKDEIVPVKRIPPPCKRSLKGMPK
jgi:hypothetical protein